MSAFMKTSIYLPTMNIYGLTCLALWRRRSLYPAGALYFKPIRMTYLQWGDIVGIYSSGIKTTKSMKRTTVDNLRANVCLAEKCWSGLFEFKFLLHTLFRRCRYPSTGPRLKGNWGHWTSTLLCLSVLIFAGVVLAPA